MLNTSMKINEIITEAINPDIAHRRFKHTQQIGDYTYTAASQGAGLAIKAYDGKKLIGDILFNFYFNPPTLKSQSTWVHKDYREQGVATTMYAYAKMLGNDVMPHPDQTDDGNRMWRSWNQSKQSKHILPKGHKGYHELDEASGTFSKVMTHETTPEAAAIIMKTGFKPSPYGIFFNVEGANYSGGGYGGTEIRAQITGPVDDILNLEDDNDLPDDLDDFAGGEEIAEYAREEGYWAWTDGVQFAVLDPRHIKVLPAATITELFEPGKDYKWSFTGSEEAVAVFHIGEIPFQFHAYTYPEANGTWDVEFKNAERGRTRYGKFGLTGTGNSAEVMSTVTDIMREFLQRYQGKVTALTFTADEQSRQSLYARMAKRLLPTWQLTQTDKQFILTAPAN